MTGALGGIRVLDFGQYVAGPLAAMLVPDQGADVIRIDRPGWTTSANATWNGGKRSVVLDLPDAASDWLAHHISSGASMPSNPSE